MMFYNLKLSNINDILNILSKTFFFLSFCIFVYIILNVFLFKKPVYEQEPLSTTPSKYSETILPPSASLKPYSQTMERDIFQTPEIASPSTPETSSVNPQEDLSKDYKVRGIMVSQTPKTIIEDLRTHETLFLSPGDHLGDLTVKTIQKDKIIFEHEEKLLELAP